jgi:hypothetical protein
MGHLDVRTQDVLSNGTYITMWLLLKVRAMPCIGELKPLNASELAVSCFSDHQLEVKRERVVLQ